jgi:urease accessory protein
MMPKHVSGSSLRGHLHLRCDLRPGGISFIGHQDFRAPIHLSKSYVDQGRCVLSLVNTTAGFFDGDQLDTDVSVSEGASLVLSSPSSARVYQTRSGAAAVSEQRFRVGDGAFLEWIPEPFIPHAGACYRQFTKLELQSSASLLYFDWISPGRVAKGEIFGYRELRWEMDLYLAGKLIARERYTMRPEDDSLEALRVKFPAAHYVSVYAAGEMTRDWPAIALDAFNGEDCYLGHGPLSGGVYFVRALCRDSLSARRLLEGMRHLFYVSAGRVPPGLGRLVF